MDETTDTLERPVFPPPQPRSFVTAGAPGSWPGQISQAGPTLPTVTPQVPRPAHVDTSPITSALFEVPATAKPTKSRGRFRRATSWLFLLAVVGGLAFAGVVYGPQLIDRVRGVDESGGPAAPLVYPTPTAPPVITRTASFTVSEPDPFGGTTEYEVTTDFESGVSRILVPRADSADIEILTVWDQSFIRRADESTWYTLPRGEFPVDYSFGRSRWIRTLDELVPPAIRQFTTIAEATESSVGTEPTRRLVVSADAAQLLQAQTASSSPTADGSPPPAPPFPAGITVEPAPEGVEEFTMELWVDGNGIVRKSVLPTQLGGQTITVTSVSADPFEPEFPAPEVVAPLTAQALFHLGL
jgi:hypothetical protein